MRLSSPQIYQTRLVPLAQNPPRDTQLESRRSRQAQIDRYLRLVGAKSKTSYLLLRTRNAASE